MKRKTAQWVRKAEADLLLVKLAGAKKVELRDLICFHCQQAIEKYLKAVLQELGWAVPYTHDLTGLIDLLIPTDRTWHRLRRGTPQLTRYAVEYRYSGMKATPRQARAAFTKALAFRVHTRQRLGLRTRRRK